MPVFRIQRLLSLAMLAAALAATPGIAFADDDIDAIRMAVFDYFEGINEVSRERIERAFDPSASLKSVADDGTIRVEPIADATRRWMAAEPQPRNGIILSVDLSHGHVARVVFDFDGAYVDFLTLLKLEGQWKIVDKVFVRN